MASGSKHYYNAFTLSELLIVMGILIILMAVGILAGRYAIQRANDIKHKNAADQIFTGTQSYFSKYRHYPLLDNIGPTTNYSGMTPEALVTTGSLDGKKGGGIADFIETFDGGTETDYYYFIQNNALSVIICVSLGGKNDISERGYYCTGNGFGSDDYDWLPIKDLVKGDNPVGSEIFTRTLEGAKSTWYGKSWSPSIE